MDYGMFWLLSAYATVGFIWFMRGINGYENVWEYQEGETKHVSKFHKIVDGVEYFWKPKRIGDTVSLQEGEWVTYDQIDTGLKPSPAFYSKLRDKLFENKTGAGWNVTHDADGSTWSIEDTTLTSLRDMSYEDALALSDEEFEKASKIK
jgi:hypothetical protein